LRAKWSEASELIREHDITTITETKLDPLATTGSLSVEGFAINRQDRTCSGGGVATYISSTLKSVPLSDLQGAASKSGLEITIDKVLFSSKTNQVIIMGVYRPPSAKSAWFDEFNELILKLVCLGQLIIMGDINADLLKPKVYPGKALRNSLKLAGTSVESTLPTRIHSNSATCLDIIAVDKRLACSEYLVKDLAASDHYPVTVQITVSSRPSVKPKMKRSFKSINYDSLQIRVQQISLPAVTESSCNSDTLLNAWHSEMLSLLDEVAPLKKCPMRRKSSPWLNDEIRGLIKYRDWLGRAVKNCPLADREHLQSKLTVSRKIVKSRVRRAMKVEGYRALQTGNSKDAWKFLKAATFTTSGTGETPIPLPILNDSLATIVQSLDPNQSLQKVCTCDNSCSFTFSQLSVNQVKNLLSNIRSNTATGHDELPGHLLKRLAPALAPNVSKIFNASLASVTFPSMWKKANVCPVYKNKGSKTDPNNYRPISILPVLARTLEKAAAAQLYNFCDVNSVIPQQQFGFRRNSSCEMAILSAMDSWMGAVDSGKFVGAILLDLSKAFDCVPHQQLLHELAKIGVGSSALNWFASYLNGREQRVSSSQEVTQWKAVGRGVPQGSCLSPLLFNIFVRDLPSCCDLDCTQFADDSTESTADKNLQIITQKLSDSFLDIKQFCTDHELVLNTAKTQFIIFKSQGRKIPAELEVVLDNCSIKPVPSVKLLGVTIDQHFTMGEHIDNVVRKCQGLLGVLRRAAPSLPRDLLRLAYVALIRSHLEYASAVLAPAAKTHLRKLDVIQKIASRIISGAPRDAHSEPLLSALGLESLESRRNDHVMKLVNSIIAGSSHPIFNDYFTVTASGDITGGCTANIGVGKKRFRIAGASLYNEKRPT
jgi:Reverse transcriptase (RNA-dependent DNA polymerase)